MKYIAHRGVSQKAPENTLAAFKLANQSTHYHAIECDIYTTKDQKFVVFHDETLNRMTKEKHKIMDLDYAEIKKLSVISGNNLEDYPNEYIPLLSEFLEVCESNQKIAQVELKSIHDMTLLSDLLELLDSKIALEKEVISFNLNYLKYMRALSPMPLRFLTTKITESLLYECRVHDLNIGINKESVKPALIQKLKKQGFNILVFTVDDYKEALEYEALGIDFLSTNHL